MIKIGYIIKTNPEVLNLISYQRKKIIGKKTKDKTLASLFQRLGR
jgi:hypothetical protein